MKPIPKRIGPPETRPPKCKIIFRLSRYLEILDEILIIEDIFYLLILNIELKRDI